MKYTLDYYDKKVQQIRIVALIYWSSGLGQFNNEIIEFVSPLPIVRIVYFVTLIAFVLIFIFFCSKNWKLVTDKKLAKSLFDEYAKENMLKTLRITFAISFTLMYLFKSFDRFHSLNTTTVLSIILYITGVVFFGSLVFFNRK